MPHLAKGQITIGEKLLLETLSGHFAWLESAHPKKAASPTVKRAKRAVESTLRSLRGRNRAA
jgi:hypothetical protein